MAGIIAEERFRRRFDPVSAFSSVQPRQDGLLGAARQALLQFPLMDQRFFHLRSRAVHEGDSNDLVRLDLEVEVDGDWEPIAFATTLPPFRAFVCSAMMCQHAYLRMNANERGLVLRVAAGELWMKTEDWFVRDVTAHFKLALDNGSPSTDDLVFISSRMRDCPISRNLTSATKETTIEVLVTA